MPRESAQIKGTLPGFLSLCCVLQSSSESGKHVCVELDEGTNERDGNGSDDSFHHTQVSISLSFRSSLVRTIWSSLFDQGTVKSSIGTCSISTHRKSRLLYRVQYTSTWYEIRSIDVCLGIGTSAVWVVFPTSRWTSVCARDRVQIFSLQKTRFDRFGTTDLLRTRFKSPRGV